MAVGNQDEIAVDLFGFSLGEGIAAEERINQQPVRSGFDQETGMAQIGDLHGRRLTGIENVRKLKSGYLGTHFTPVTQAIVVRSGFRMKTFSPQSSQGAQRKSRDGFIQRPIQSFQAIQLLPLTFFRLTIMECLSRRLDSLCFL